jgi:hypothetical protein
MQRFYWTRRICMIQLLRGTEKAVSIKRPGSRSFKSPPNVRSYNLQRSMRLSKSRCPRFYLVPSTKGGGLLPESLVRLFTMSRVTLRFVQGSQRRRRPLSDALVADRPYDLPGVTRPNLSARCHSLPGCLWRRCTMNKRKRHLSN